MIALESQQRRRDAMALRIQWAVASGDAKAANKLLDSLQRDPEI